MNRTLAVFFILYIFSSCKEHKSSVIKDYEPVTFKYELTKPFVFRRNKSLYYSNGKGEEIDKNKIYDLDDKPEYHERNIFVSPDSKWIILKDNDELLLLDHQGKKQSSLGKTKTDLEFEFEKNKFRWEEIQFSPDSKYILLIQDKSGKSGRTNTNLIYTYDLTNQQLKPLHEAPFLWDANFGKSNRSIFYWYFDTPDTKKVVEISIEDGSTLNTYNSIHDSLLFFNYDPRKLTNQTSDLKFQVTDKWSLHDSLLTDGIYLVGNGRQVLLMESTLADPNFKGFRFSNHHRHKSYFLPGDRYYAFENRSEEYQGFLLYDTKDLRYQEIGKNIDFYFSLTSDEVDSKIGNKPEYPYFKK